MRPATVDAGIGPARRRHVPAALLAALAATALLASACGLPYAGSPQSLPEQLPAQLTNPTVLTPVTTLPVPNDCNGCSVADFYYVQGSFLRPFPQSIRRQGTVSAVMSVVLSTLENGPSIKQAGEDGATSYLPPGSHLSPLGVVKHVAHIGLDEAYYELGLQQEVFELGQIVYSVLNTTALGAKSVLFYSRSSGQWSPVDVVNGSGQDVTGSVTTAAYCVIAINGCPTGKKTPATLAK
jgi:hypothetical protein